MANVPGVKSAGSRENSHVERPPRFGSRAARIVPLIGWPFTKPEITDRTVISLFMIALPHISLWTTMQVKCLHITCTTISQYYYFNFTYDVVPVGTYKQINRTGHALGCGD